MSVNSNSAKSTAAIVPYNPNLLHISVTSHLDDAIDEVYRQSFELAKIEAGCLSPLGLAWKERVVTGIARGEKYLYIDEELGDKMARLITRNFRHGHYNGCISPSSFKEAILRDLRSICSDQHLNLSLSEQAIPEYDPDRSLRTLDERELTTQQKNYMDDLSSNRPDFSKEVEAHIIPDTEIGYFKINLFPFLEFPETREIIDQAMKVIENAESLIIDLRENHGGNPATVAYVASYLFNEKQLWNQVYERFRNELTSFYVEPEKLGQVFGDQKPICVLTSEQTFSGGEELAYSLQASKRATIIGQSTGGGAHPVRAFVVDDHIFACVPYAKSINPHTGKNWEGTGVLPDHVISEGADALAFARDLIEHSCKF